MAEKISPISPSKNVETYIGEYVLRLLYAACADVENDLNGEGKFSPYTFHSYASICVAKKDRIKLDARFVVSDSAKQMLAFIFDKIIEECLAITIDNEDTAETLQTKISENTDDSFFKFAIALTHMTTPGAVLQGACDPGCGLRGFVVGKMPAYVSKDRILSLIFTSIDGFLKASADKLMRMWWFQRKAIDGGMLSGMYYAFGLNQYMVDDLVGCLREKPAAKPRAKKPADKPADNVASEVVNETSKLDEEPINPDDKVMDLSALDAVLGDI